MCEPPAFYGTGVGSTSLARLQYEAKSDLSQIGGDFDGHFWYAHIRDTAHLGGNSGLMTVKGTWAPEKNISEAVTGQPGEGWVEIVHVMDRSEAAEKRRQAANDRAYADRRERAAQPKKKTESPAQLKYLNNLVARTGRARANGSTPRTTRRSRAPASLHVVPGRRCRRRWGAWPRRWPASSSPCWAAPELN